MNNENENYLIRDNLVFDEHGRVKISDVDILVKINAAAGILAIVANGLEADQVCPVINDSCINGDCPNWKNSICPHPNTECSNTHCHDGITC
jgi:hypothetical protein